MTVIAERDAALSDISGFTPPPPGEAYAVANAPVDKRLGNAVNAALADPSQLGLDHLRDVHGYSELIVYDQQGASQEHANALHEYQALRFKTEEALRQAGFSHEAKETVVSFADTIAHSKEMATTLIDLLNGRDVTSDNPLIEQLDALIKNVNKTLAPYDVTFADVIRDMFYTLSASGAAMGVFTGAQSLRANNRLRDWLAANARKPKGDRAVTPADLFDEARHKNFMLLGSSSLGIASLLLAACGAGVGIVTSSASSSPEATAVTLHALAIAKEQAIQSGRQWINVPMGDGFFVSNILWDEDPKNPSNVLSFVGLIPPSKGRTESIIEGGQSYALGIAELSQPPKAISELHVLMMTVADARGNAQTWALNYNKADTENLRTSSFSASAASFDLMALVPDQGVQPLGLRVHATVDATGNLILKLVKNPEVSSGIPDGYERTLVSADAYAAPTPAALPTAMPDSSDSVHVMKQIIANAADRTVGFITGARPAEGSNFTPATPTELLFPATATLPAPIQEPSPPPSPTPETQIENTETVAKMVEISEADIDTDTKLALEMTLKGLDNKYVVEHYLKDEQGRLVLWLKDTEFNQKLSATLLVIPGKGSILWATSNSYPKFLQANGYVKSADTAVVNFLDGQDGEKDTKGILEYYYAIYQANQAKKTFKDADSYNAYISKSIAETSTSPTNNALIHLALVFYTKEDNSVIPFSMSNITENGAWRAYNKTALEDDNAGGHHAIVSYVESVDVGFPGGFDGLPLWGTKLDKLKAEAPAGHPIKDFPSSQDSLMVLTTFQLSPWTTALQFWSASFWTSDLNMVSDPFSRQMPSDPYFLTLIKYMGYPPTLLLDKGITLNQSKAYHDYMDGKTNVFPSDFLIELIKFRQEFVENGPIRPELIPISR